MYMDVTTTRRPQNNQRKKLAKQAYPSTYPERFALEPLSINLKAIRSQSDSLSVFPH
jgi:hypothetical protein